jgi:hypothetical protein
MRKLLVTSAEMMRRSSTLILPHTRGMLDTINVRRRQIIDERLTQIPIESYSVRFLRYILSRAPIEYLCSISDIYEMYEYIAQYKDMLEQPLQINSTSITHNIFFSGKTKEFIFPVSCVDYYSHLPISPELAEWKKIRPIRVVSHDSKELSLKMYLNKIIFDNDPPTYAVITIDIVFLVLYFVRYLQETNRKYTGEATVSFIHEYVLTTNLARDIVDIWLLSMYGSILVDPTYRPTQYTNNNIYSTVSGRIVESCSEIRKRSVSITSGSMTPQEFLNCLPVSDGRTYFNLLDEMFSYSNISDLFQYEWASLLHDYQLLRLITLTVAKNKNLSISRTISTRLNSALSILEMSQFWNSVRDKKVEQKIVDMFYGIFSDVK